MSERRIRSVRVIERCDLCAMPLPLNSPTLEAECPQCGGANPIDRVFWKHLLMDVDHGTAVSPPDGVVADVAEGNRSEGRPIEVPAWLKADMPSIVGLVASPDGPSSAATEPVVMQCPKCAAGLTIDASRPRTTTCEFCQASVYLPDGLWRQFHPVEQARWWSVTFEGLSTVSRHRAVGTIKTKLEGLRKLEGHMTRFSLKRNVFSWVLLWLALTLVIGLPSCGISTCVGSDPLFGLMGRYVCPKTCDTCAPPLRMRQSSSNGRNSTHFVCATGGDGTRRGTDDVDMSLIFGTFLGFWAIVATALWLVFKIRALLTRGSRLEKVRAKIAKLEAERLSVVASLQPRSPP